MPSLDADLGLPAEQSLGLLDRRPAPRHVDLECRQMLQLELAWILAACLPDDARSLGDGQLVRGGDVEVLVQAGGRGHRRDYSVGNVVDVRERARLLARAEDLERVLSGEHLLDQVGHHVRHAGLVLWHLARAVGVEGAADRERQAVLGVSRACVDLAREL